MMGGSLDLDVQQVGEVLSNEVVGEDAARGDRLPLLVVEAKSREPRTSIM
jgi:hypothetical protein